MGLQTTITKRTRQSKMKAMVGRLSIAIAKKRGNPDFNRYMKTRRRFLGLKKKMILKHRPEAIAAVRKLISQQTVQK